MENEQAVVEALKKGDKQALGQLFDQFAPSLFGMAIRLTESEQKASEAIQTAFQQMLEEASTFDPAKSDLFAWALGITLANAREAGAKSEQFDFAAYQASHSVGADIRELSRDLEEKHRKVIELSYFDGLSESALEKAMNFPVGTVNTRLRFSVRELRRVLK